MSASSKSSKGSATSKGSVKKEGGGERRKKTKRSETQNIVRFLHTTRSGFHVTRSNTGNHPYFNVASETIQCMKDMKGAFYTKVNETLSELMHRNGSHVRVKCTTESHLSDVHYAMALMLQPGDLKEKVANAIKDAGLSFINNKTGGVRSFGLVFQPGFAKDALRVGGRKSQVSAACVAELLSALEVIFAAIRDKAVEMRTFVLRGRGLSAEYIHDEAGQTLLPTHLARAIDKIPEVAGLFTSVRFPNASRLVAPEILAATNAKQSKKSRVSTEVKVDSSLSARKRSPSPRKKRSPSPTKKKSVEKKSVEKKSASSTKKKSTKKKSIKKKSTSSTKKKPAAGRKSKPSTGKKPSTGR